MIKLAEMVCWQSQIILKAQRNNQNYMNKIHTPMVNWHQIIICKRILWVGKTLREAMLNSWESLNETTLITQGEMRNSNIKITLRIILKSHIKMLLWPVKIQAITTKNRRIIEIHSGAILKITAIDLHQWLKEHKLLGKARR